VATHTASPARVRVLGHPLDLVDLDEAAELVVGWVNAGSTAAVVTLNPELVVRARDDRALREAIDAATLSVPDGVGIVWAARRVGVTVPGRVPGVELVERILERSGSGVTAFFLGGRPGIAERAAKRATDRFGTVVVGTRDGYFSEDDEVKVAADVAASGAQLLLVGLGERQERFLHERRSELGASVAIGVGGTLDVLAGAAKRTPAWTRRLGLEWAWRVGLDPARWHRAPRLLRFVVLTLRSR